MSSSTQGAVPLGLQELGGMSYAPPDDWRAQVVRLYSAPRHDPDAPSIAVTRWPRGGASSVEAFAFNHLMSFAKRLPQFEFLAREEMTVGGCRAARAHFRAVRGDPGRLLHEIIVYIGAPDDHVVTVSCTFGEGGAARAREAMDRLLASVQFRSAWDEPSSVRLQAPRVPPAPPPPAPPPFAAIPMPGQRRR